jgi:hypothetical protein
LSKGTVIVEAPAGDQELAKPRRKASKKTAKKRGARAK